MATSFRIASEAGMDKAQPMMPSLVDALDAIPGQCALIDRKGTILHVNEDWRAFAEANGYQSADGDFGFGVGTNYLRVCEAASGDCCDGALSVVRGLRAVLEGELPQFDLEYPCHSPDEQRWFKCLARAVPGQGSDEAWALVQHVNVTDQVRKRLSAEAGRRQLQVFSEALGLHWWSLDTSSQMLTLSAVLADLVGNPSETSLPLEQWRNRITTGDRREFDAAIESIHASGASVEAFSFGVGTSECDERHLSFLGWHSADRSRIEGLAVDVTDQRKAKRALAEFDQRLRSLFDAMPIRVANLDRSLRYRYVNRAFADGVRLPKASIEGTLACDVLGTVLWDMVQERMCRALAGQTNTIEVDTTSQSGDRVQALITCIPERSASGGIDGIYAIVQDVSMLKQREEELLCAKNEAVRASKAKSDFLACMSHDLRTPLNAIIGFAGILRDVQLSSSIDPRTREYADYILSSGEHLLEMVNGLLDLSAIEAGRNPIQLAPIDMAQLIDDCARTIGPRARDRQITVTTRVAEGLSQFHADPKAMKQVLLNLVSNAVKFTEPGGTVDIHARRVGAEIGITVADTGPGIASEKLDAVFEPFVYGVGTGKSASIAAKQPDDKSWGLGLAISRALIEQHGGSLQVESELGVGSAFTVRIPAVQTDVDGP